MCTLYINYYEVRCKLHIVQQIYAPSGNWSTGIQQPVMICWLVSHGTTCQSLKLYNYYDHLQLNLKNTVTVM